MKKFLALVMAMMMILAMGTVAFADEEIPSATSAPSTGPVSVATTKTFQKTYTTSSGKEKSATFPAETLSFNVVAVQGNPDETMISIEDQTVDANLDDITINIPSYSKVGKYNYTVSEEAGETQGVVYSTTSFGVQVLVTYNDARTALDTQVVFTSGTTGKKIEGFDNQYLLGGLKVTKNVTGTLASTSQKFNIDVTFKASKPVKSAITYTVAGGTEQTISVADMANESKKVTVELAHGQTATFSNIPAGVTYTVEEQSQHTTAGVNDPAKGYTVTYTGATGTISAECVDEATVTNAKYAIPDTGISMDNAPYMMIMALVVLAGAAMLLKKRAYND